MKIIRIVVITCLVPINFYARSILRPGSKTDPYITTHWLHSDQLYTLKNSHLTQGPLFCIFDREHVFKNILPLHLISFRHNKSQQVSGKTLSEVIEQFLQEVKTRKKTFTFFTVLKDKDFDKKTNTGLIIARFKDYPFVVKLFIERPETFIKPLKKGFQPTCFFMMGGGVTRHLSGFTRIKNLNRLTQRIQDHPIYRDLITFPRKWFWLPAQEEWFQVNGYNIGPTSVQSIQLPAVYAIVADYIETEKIFSLSNKQNRILAMRISNYLKQHNDPHINNFVVEKNTLKIVLLDTEHFPTMVGLEDPPQSRNYWQWYSRLSCKMIYDTLGRDRRSKSALQQSVAYSIDP